MSHRFIHGASILLALIALLISCTDLPTDPALNPSNAFVRFILREDVSPVVDNGAVKEIGLQVNLTNLIDSVYISSECTAYDTVFAVDSVKMYDTVWFSPRFTDEGECVITAEATMRDKNLQEKTGTLSILVLAEKPGIHFVAIAPERTTVTGAVDTLLFVTRITGGISGDASYELTVAPEEGAGFFIPEYSPLKDTAWVICSNASAGTYSVALVAMVADEEVDYSDTATVSITVEGSVAPSVVYAPEQLIAGKADTLVFAVDNSSRPDPLTIALLEDSSLNPTAFSLVPSGPDSIVIAILADAEEMSDTIVIITSNGTESDTSSYPVTLISPEAALWNETALSLNLVEGTPFSYDFAEYIASAHAQDVTLSTTIGTIEGTSWSFTPEWGCSPEQSVTVTATKGEITLNMTVTLAIAAGDADTPVITLTDPALDGKSVSSSQVTVECKAVDAGAGVTEVSFTSDDQTVAAAPQGDDIYSGVIDGLVHGVPTVITITATDNSRAKNSETLTITVTRDSTMLDGEPPAIVQTTGPKNGERVKSNEGTLTCTVNDNSGVDSVWWTLNGEYAGTPEFSSGTATVHYTLQTFGENVIAVSAKDGSPNGNTGSVSVMVNYNTVPSEVTLISPEGSAHGISATPTFSWSGADDADNDTVLFRVLYRKNSETVFISGPEVTEKSYILPDAVKLDPFTLHVWKVVAYTKKFPDTVSSNESEFTTFDPTAEDLIGPKVAGIGAPDNGSRVLTAVGSFTVSVSDNSGVDSVWLMQNDVFAGKLAVQEGICTVAYANLNKGSNTITVVAQDGATAKNRDSLSLTLIYNTKPEPLVIPIVVPEEATSGVSTTPQFVWNKVTDAEGDAVLYMVRYGKSKVNLDRNLSETSDTSVAISAAEKLDANATWYWQVTACTKTPYADTVSSDVHSFKTSGIAAKITTQPSLTDSLFSGGTLTLTVAAEGTPVPTYQWYNGTTPLTGQTSATFTKTNISSADDGAYTVVVKNGAGPDVTSDPVTVKVLTKVKITTDPQDKPANEGEDVTFTVAAEGDPTLTWQWQKDKQNTGGNSATFKMNGVTTENNGKYRCIVYNSFSRDTSAEAILSVTATPVYTVKFDTDGGSSVDSQRVKSGEKAKVPAPNPSKSGGYEFAGWFPSKTSTTEYNFNTTITGPTTIYAKWTPVFTVTYDANGGEGSVTDSKTYKSGDWVTVKSSSGLTRSGHTFEKWTTEQNGSGSSYGSGNTFQIGSDNVKLWAQWKAQCVITFDGSGATTPPSPASKTIDVGASIGSLPTAPKKTAYVFSGWWTGEGGAGDTVRVSDIFSSSKTLYAKWVIRDVDGNLYTEVKIGNQVWMVENLKTTRYRDRSSIEVVLDNSKWSELATGGIGWYEGSSTNRDIYGVLYNGYTISSQLPPEGWRVPSTDDWNELFSTIGGVSGAVDKLNSRGFKLLFGGYRKAGGSYDGLSSISRLWTSTENGIYLKCYEFNDILGDPFNGLKNLGFSVRCIRDY